MARQRPQLMHLMLTAAAFVVVVAGMKAAAPLIVLFLLAVFIAVITTPMFIGLQRRGVPAWLAFVILILGLLLLAVLSIGVIGRSLNDVARNLPFYQERLQEQVTALILWMEQREIDVPSNIISEILDTRNFMSVVGNSISAFTNILGKAFVILLIVIFILFEATILPRKLRALPGMDDTNWDRLQQVVDTFRRYMGMKTLISLATGLLIWGLLTLCGIQFAVLFGGLAFMLNFVPNVGSILAAIPAVLLALIEFGWGRAAGVGVGYLAINIVVGNLIEPRFIGRGLGVSPMIIVVSLIFWGWVLGPIGMLLSVPLTMTIKLAMESIEETRGMAMLIGSAIPDTKSPDEPPVT